MGSQIFYLDVGPSATRFLVHSTILEKSSIAPAFAASTSNDRLILLPELDEATAHTLVHYLYSSDYQIQENRLASKSDMSYEDYRLATCVYCAAMRYNIPGLAQLAKQKIGLNGVFLPIFDILTIAKNHGFPLLPENEPWYSEYLELSITEAMKENPEPFRNPDFITKFGGNSRLLQVIWKTVMRNFAQGSIAPASTDNATRSRAQTPVAESNYSEADVVTEDNLHQLPSPTESVVNSPPPSRADGSKEQDNFAHVPSSPKAVEVPDVPSTEAEATSQLGETSNDDLGLPTIEPTFGQSKEVGFERDQTSETKKLGHVRADSVLDEDMIAPGEGEENEKRGSVSDAVPGSNGNQETPKKNKKKTKKKHSSIVF